jgi:tetratricopeptide (TPR) repeat protein
LKYHEKSLEYVEKTGDAEDRIRALINIGMNLFRLEKFNEALETYKKAESLMHMVENASLNAILYNNMGSVFKIQALYDYAKKLYLKAIEFADKSGNINVKLRCLIHLGDIHAQQKDLRKSLKNYQDAMDIAEKIESKVEIEDIKTKIKDIQKTTK